MYEAAKHDGTSVIEILQNCVIFNDGAHKAIADRATAPDRQLILKHGEPMIFGKDNNKGIRLGSRGLEVVTIGENGITEKIFLYMMLSNKTQDCIICWQICIADYPIALGVIRSVPSPTYDELLESK